MSDQPTTQDPRAEGAKPPFPQQEQPYPGFESEMDPKPDFGESSYRGSGKLRDRVALITGADSGIGRAVALAFAREGADIAIAYLDEDEDARDTARVVTDAGRQSITLPGDIRDEQHCQDLVTRTVEEFGRLDILVNNAARLESLPWDELEFELWRQVMAVNLDGPMLMCKALVPLMRRNAWGRIVNVASGSILQPIVGSIAYRASKMGLIGLTRALSSELGEDGITINAACPSITDTPMATAGLSEEHIAGMVSRQAFKRIAHVNDISGAVMFLTCEDSGWVTGQTILVNAGASFL